MSILIIIQILIPGSAAGDSTFRRQAALMQRTGWWWYSTEEIGETGMVQWRNLPVAQRLPSQGRGRYRASA